MCDRSEITLCEKFTNLNEFERWMDEFERWMVHSHVVRKKETFCSRSKIFMKSKRRFTFGHAYVTQIKIRQCLDNI